MVNDKLRLAIVGCGAVTELLHIPALKQIRDVVPTVFADLDLRRATHCASQFKGRPVADWREASSEVDAVIVCTSPHNHHAICYQAIASGKHVLCEKPFVFQSQEAAGIVKRAQDANIVLGVCHARRLFWNSRFIKTLFDVGALGHIQSVEMEEGAPYGWPQKSGDIFNSNSFAGVFLASGIHCLDLLYWWCNGRLEPDEHLQDGFAGPEANSHTRLMGQNFGREFVATLKFSTTRRLSNSITIKGSKASVQVPSVYRGESLSILDASLGDKNALGALFPMEVKGSQISNLSDAHTEQLLSFAKACSGVSEYYLPMEDVVAEIALTERCQKRRTLIDMPWVAVSKQLRDVVRAL
jgi:predicted dehydrogenase